MLDPSADLAEGPSTGLGFWLLDSIDHHVCQPFSGGASPLPSNTKMTSSYICFSSMLLGAYTSPFASKISRVGFQICLDGSWITSNYSRDLL
jgi:hypothetical protein